MHQHNFCNSEVINARHELDYKPRRFASSRQVRGGIKQTCSKLKRDKKKMQKEKVGLGIDVHFAYKVLRPKVLVM
jgi:hypothetical protein